MARGVKGSNTGKRRTVEESARAGAAYLTGSSLHERARLVAEAFRTAEGDIGETACELAATYDVSPATVLRWRALGESQDLPLLSLEERASWREELARTLMRHIDRADAAGASDLVVKLIDRLAKLGGLDHAHMQMDRIVEVEQTKVAIMLRAVQSAIAAAGLDERTAAQLRDALATELVKGELVE